MTKYQIIRFVTISIFCCLAMIFFLYSTMDRANSFKNGFNRLFKFSTLEPQAVVDLGDDGYYISGNTDNRIYIGHIQWPFRVLIFNKLLNDSQTINLKFPEVKSFWKDSRLLVDSPYVYSCDGLKPAFYRGNINSKGMEVLTKKTSYFTKAININPNSFIVRAVSKEKVNTLVKIQLDSPFVIMKDGILIKQIDGIFCTDGQFKYDKKSNKLVYVYYYRNQYLLLDSNLNVIHAGKTIDTNAVAKLSISNISKTGDYKFSAPPVFVNVAFCIQNNRIYVRSALLADNEGRTTLKDQNVIDIYSIENGKYLQSFYIPKIGRESIVDMQIMGRSLVALFNKHLAVYDISKFIE